MGAAGGAAAGAGAHLPRGGEAAEEGGGADKWREESVVTPFSFPFSFFPFNSNGFI